MASESATTPIRSADSRLETLLELWDRLDEDAGVPNSLGVTLVVQGTTYSGLLLPGRVWARMMSQLLQDAGQNHQISALGVFFDDIEKSYETAGDPTEARSYAHLANAVVGTPAEGRATGLMLRIRASDVSGWSVGTAGALPPLQQPESRGTPGPSEAGS